MFKRTLSLVAVFFFGVSAALAAPAASLSGKVVAIEGNKVQVTITTEAPKWLKKGAVIKLTDKAGQVVETAAKVTELSEQTVTITTKDAANVKQGDTLSLQKGRVMSGC